MSTTEKLINPLGGGNPIVPAWANTLLNAHGVRFVDALTLDMQAKPWCMITNAHQDAIIAAKSDGYLVYTLLDGKWCTVSPNARYNKDACYAVGELRQDLREPEWEPQQGDVVEVRDKGDEWQLRIFSRNSEVGASFDCLTRGYDGSLSEQVSQFYYETASWCHCRPAHVANVIKATPKPQYKLFEMQWDSEDPISPMLPCGHRVASVGKMTIDGYRIFGYTSGASGVAGTEYVISNKRPFSQMPCTSKYNHKYAIGRLEE